MAKKKKFNFEEFDLAGTMEEPVEEVMNAPEEPEEKEVQNIAKEEAVTEVEAPVKEEQKVVKQTVKTIEKEEAKEESAQKVETRGRKKNPNTQTPKYIPVNIVNIDHDLDLLRMKYQRENGIKGTLGVGTFIRILCEKEIEKDKDYLEKARVILG